MKSFNKTTINSIAKYLSQFKKDLIKNELYFWKGENFTKTIKLRKILSDELNNAKKHQNFEEFYKVCKEIVQDWGGIYIGKDNSTRQANFKKMVTEIFNHNNEDFTNVPFERIASRSKILSFIAPNKYIIYDSRVSYCINGILLTKCNDNHYFPISPPRKSKKSIKRADDIKTLICLKYKQNYKEEGLKQANKKLRIPRKEAYDTLNNLVKDVHKKLWEETEHAKLYYTEMILFSIAYKDVYEDILKNIKLV